ncbi:MAG: cytochrome c-type biogenesis protein CcmH [Deltaproteobacteria bacterium]|nr:cytochrome c-type biogenesis protein CcmH [Deltaproteobacteria bacterium]
MCICPDDCGKVLINCTCSDSDRYRQQIRAMIDQGLSADQIIDRFVAEKGKIVLAAPTTKGFDLTAWVLPFVALGVSIPIVALVIRRLGARSSPNSAENVESPDSTVSAVDSSLEAKLRRELDDLDR